VGNGDKYFQEGTVKIEESTISELFKVMRENTAAVSRVDKNLSELCATVKEREKGCERHNRETDDHNKRLSALELWKAGQEGLGAFLWKATPIMFAFISLGVAIYVAIHK